MRKERLAEAARYLDRVGTMQTRSQELLSLKDKANLALGFALLQAQRAADAKPILQRIRLEGPYSSKALLGVGWADAGMGEFKRALVPWLALRKRSLLDSAVQESFLTVPYAYSAVGGHRAGRRGLQHGDRILRFRNASASMIRSNRFAAARCSIGC